MDPSGLRPLRVGEILDVGIKIYRRRFGTMVRAVAVVVVPIAVLSAVVQLSAGVEPDQGADGGDIAAAVGGSLVTTVLGLVGVHLSIAACYEIVSGDYFDRAPTWRESLRVARSRLGSLIWVGFLHYTLAGIALVACVAPGVYLWVAWSLAVPALMLEGARGRAALRRSRALVKDRWWPTFGALLLMFLLTSIVQGAVQSVLLGVVASAGGELVDAVAAAVATSITQSLVTPFTAAVVMVIYFDLRVRKEGFDLELLARSIGVDPPAEVAGSLAPEVTADDQPPYWPPPPGWKPGSSAGE